MDSLANHPAVSELIDLALAEDVGRGDVTSEAIFGGEERDVVAELVAREELVVFGLGVFGEVFRRLSGAIAIETRRRDGENAGAGEVVATIRGPVVAVLSGERTALNFVQRLSGIATLSRRFADAVSGTSARIVDTRKTTPGYRVLEKAAVAAGGCYNHRADLASGILIKDNHIAAAGSVAEAVSRAKLRAPHSLRIEVEVGSTHELEQAIDAGVDVVLLDNMSIDKVRVAAQRARAAGILVEVSGGVVLDNVAAYAAAGADIISVGALTHSARAVDLALDFK